MSLWPLCTRLFFLSSSLNLKRAFLLLSWSGVRQQHGEKPIPWTHLLIPLGTTWGTRTLTTGTGEGCRHRAVMGQARFTEQKGQKRPDTPVLLASTCLCRRWCKPLWCPLFCACPLAWVPCRVDLELLLKCSIWLLPWQEIYKSRMCRHNPVSYRARGRSLHGRALWGRAQKKSSAEELKIVLSGGCHQERQPTMTLSERAWSKLWWVAWSVYPPQQYTE